MVSRNGLCPHIDPLGSCLRADLYLSGKDEHGPQGVFWLTHQSWRWSWTWLCSPAIVRMHPPHDLERILSAMTTFYISFRWFLKAVSKSSRQRNHAVSPKCGGCENGSWGVQIVIGDWTPGSTERQGEENHSGVVSVIFPKRRKKRCLAVFNFTLVENSTKSLHQNSS